MERDDSLRFYNCREYDRCLNVAARANKVFSCENCQNYRPEKIQLDEQSAAGCFLLLAQICGEKHRHRLETLAREFTRNQV